MNVPTTKGVFLSETNTVSVRSHYLAMRVEEDDDLSSRGDGAVVPAPNETLALGVAHHPDATPE